MEIVGFINLVFKKMLLGNNMKISTFNINKFQGAYSNPNTKGGYYNPRNIDFITPIEKIIRTHLEKENDIVFLQEFYDAKYNDKIGAKEYFENNGYRVFHNMKEIAKSHVVAITLEESKWKIIEIVEEIKFRNKFIEMKLEKKSLKIISFHNTDNYIKDRINSEFKKEAKDIKDIFLGDFNDTEWVDDLHNSCSGKYCDLVTNDMITFKPAQTTIDRIFINKDKYENKITFNGPIETYTSDHNLLTFILNI